MSSQNGQRIRWTVLTSICLLMVSHLTDGSTDNHQGHAFRLSFLKNFATSRLNGVIIETDNAATVFIDVPSSGVVSRHDVPAHSSLQVQLPYQLAELPWGIPERKAVSVYATQPVSVYGVTTAIRSKGVFLAVPMDKWGDHYIVATYNAMPHLGADIVVIGAEDNTSVSIWLNVVQSTRCVSGSLPVEVSLLLSFTLNSEEVLRLSCENDLTGSVVKGSSPIGVLSGNMCANVPSDSAFCDHIVEMLIPTKWLGHYYIVPPIDHTYGNGFRVRLVYIIDDGSTTVDIRYDSSEGTLMQDNRLFMEVAVSENTTVQINASKPILVVSYLVGIPVRNYSVYGDAAMALVPPVDRFQHVYNVHFNWSQLLTDVDPAFSVFVVCNDSSTLSVGDEVFDVTKAFGFDIAQALVQPDSQISRDSVTPPSGILIRGDSPGTSVAFPAGMKMDYFNGTDLCAVNPCLNQGICYSHGSTRKCFCGTQLTGALCETDIHDACLSSPCMNSGVCVDLSYEFRCECSANFAGLLCETELQPRNESLHGSCACACVEYSEETMEEKTEKIVKELTVNKKTTHKAIATKRSTFDSRPSATGIGILGVVFLALVFGGIVFLDLSSALAYIIQKTKEHVKERKEASLLQRVPTANGLLRNVLKGVTSEPQPLRPLTVTTPGSIPSPSPMCDTRRVTRADGGLSDPLRTSLAMPRFRVDEQGVSAVGTNGESFQFRRPSWSLKKQLIQVQAKDALVLDVKDAGKGQSTTPSFKEEIKIAGDVSIFSPT